MNADCKDFKYKELMEYLRISARPYIAKWHVKLEMLFIIDQPKVLFNKFIKQVEKNFKNLPKPLEWLSVLNHGLPLLMDFCEQVQEVSIQHQLSQKCSIGR